MMVFNRNRSQVLPQSVVLVRCRSLQDLLVLQGTMNSTRKKYRETIGKVHLIALPGFDLRLPTAVFHAESLA